MVQSNNKIVTHWCPKIGNSISIDTSRSKSCVNCKFKVQRLVYAIPIFVQYVFLAHFISIALFIILMFIADELILGMPLTTVAITISFVALNISIYSFRKTIITLKHHDVQLAKIQELRNYAMRII